MDSKLPKCTMLVGVPASGKSTYAVVSGLASSCVYISTDDIIEAIALDNGFTYDEIFKDAIGLAEKIMWKQLQYCHDKGWDVVIDRTNLTKKSRARFIRFLTGYEFEAVVFPTPDNWEERLASRPGKTIPQNVLNSMKLDYPVLEEGFSCIMSYQS